MRRVGLVLVFGAVLARGEPQAARRPELAGDLPAAEAAYEQELKAKPSADTWERLGLVRHLQNKYAEAIPAFREAIRLERSRWTSNVFLGICFYRTNQFAQALSELERADRLAPANHAGRDEIDYWLGATHIALNRPLVGLQRLERLLARNAQHKDALELAVRTYADLGSSVWNEVADKSFETAPGYEVHGHALESEGNHEGALEAFRTAKRLDPQRAGPGLSMGRILLRSGKAEEAFDVLQNELKLRDADPEAYYYAGLAAVQLARYSEAAPLMEAAARWVRHTPDAPVALAQVYLALKEPGKAVEASRKAVEAAPSSVAAHELLLSALAQIGDQRNIEAEKQRWRQREKQ